jgi:hypothetical protein
MDISGQVLSVVGEFKNTKFGPRTVWRVSFSDGQVYDTWKAAISTKAQQLQGQQVDIRAEVTQNTGNDGTVYTNNTLLDIAPSGQLGAAAVETLLPMPVGASLSPSGVVGNGAAPPIPIVASQGGMSPERESKIVKQSCLSTAFNFVGNFKFGPEYVELDEAVATALDLAKTLYAEVYGQQNVAQTPALVAQAVNAAAGVDAVKVGAETPEW